MKMSVEELKLSFSDQTLLTPVKRRDDDTLDSAADQTVRVEDSLENESEMDLDKENKERKQDSQTPSLGASLEGDAASNCSKAVSTGSQVFVVDDWSLEEVTALMDYVSKFGTVWNNLDLDPILSLRHCSSEHCQAKFDEIFAVNEVDVSYHFPIMELKKPQNLEKPEATHEDKDEANEQNDDMDLDGDNDDLAENDETSLLNPKKDKEDDEFVLDESADEDEDEEESEDDDEDELMQRANALKGDDWDFDEELFYHPSAYYPDIFKRPRRLLQDLDGLVSQDGLLLSDPSRRRSTASKGSRFNSNDAGSSDEEVYRSRGTRQSTRLRSSGAPRKRYNEDFDPLDEVLDEIERGAKSPSDEPKEKIDRVLAMRETTQKIIEDEKLEKSMKERLAVREIKEYHPEMNIAMDEEGQNVNQSDESLEVLKFQSKIGNRVDMLRAADDHEIIIQYLIKPEGVSYKHCEWLTIEEVESRFGENGINRCNRFQNKRVEVEEENEALWGGEPFDPSFQEVERVIAKTISDENGARVVKYLVKWSELPYSECTWETPEYVGDQAKISEFIRFNTPPPPASPSSLRPPDPSRLAEWYKESPKFKNGNSLRDYQIDGLNWLIQCFHLKRNPILADEMGLGKTIQSVSYLNYMFTERNIRGPFLVVVPLSTIQHWKREVDTWTEMNAVVYYEPVNGKLNRAIIREHEFYYPGTNRVKFQVLITTYETIIADVEELLQIFWEQIIVDEGHRLKNKNAKLVRCLLRLNIKRRMLLTGTPIQNNTEELWTLLNYVEPEVFFSSEEFLSRFGELKEASQVEDLQREIRPYVLRRMKENVEKSIPPKEETIIDIELTTLQKQYYRAIYERNRDFLFKGVDKANLPSLMNIEMELRKCCNHPFLIKGVEEKAVPHGATNDEYFDITVAASGKLVLLDKLLPKLYTEGHKVLIFSQMKKVLDILEEYIEFKGYEYERLDGSSQGNIRQAAIDRFSKKDSKRFVFLLSTRAGGVGLNLTAADTVIIYDSDWNPQQDIQAQARVHRIGQQKNVMIYRLVTRNTYESEMFDRASKKLGLDQAVLSRMQNSMSGGASTAQATKPSKDELDRLLKLGAYGLLDDDDSASKSFCESNINDILAHKTRVVRHETQSGGEAGALGSINFSKMTFASAGADSSIDINDPDFWEKVLAASSANTDEHIDLSRLSIQLVDGSAARTKKSQEEFFNLLKRKIRQTIVAKQNGREVNDLYDTIALLKTFSTAKKFTSSMKSTAKAWIKDLQRRGGRRSSGGYDSGGDEDAEIDIPKIPNSRGARKGKAVSSMLSELSESGDSSVEEYDDDSDADIPSNLPGARGPIRRGGIKGKSAPKGDLCGECFKRGRLVMCDGPCGFGYHTSCDASLSDEVPSEEATWLCRRCKTGQYACTVCKEIGDFDPDSEDPSSIKHCSQAGCSSFYHFQCAKSCELTNFLKSSSTRFRCPRHYCRVCEKGAGSTSVFCAFCATAFHNSCFPSYEEFVRLSSKCIICPMCLGDMRDDDKWKDMISSSVDKMDVEPLRNRNTNAVIGNVSKRNKSGKKKLSELKGIYNLRIKAPSHPDEDEDEGDFEKLQDLFFENVPVRCDLKVSRVTVNFEDAAVSRDEVLIPITRSTEDEIEVSVVPSDEENFPKRVDSPDDMEDDGGSDHEEDRQASSKRSRESDLEISDGEEENSRPTKKRRPDKK